MTDRRQILEITSYPPPRAGWGVRVQFLKQYLERNGHCCTVLNIGRSRKLPSAEYETVQNGADYLRKLWRFSRRGFVAHVHVNGDSPKGFVLAITAELVSLLWGRRCFLTFHAGPDQQYFPRPKYPLLLPMFWLLFTIPSRIVCNSDAVRKKISEYRVSPDKIFPIPAFSRQYLEAEIVPLGPALEHFYARFPVILFCYLNVRPEFFPEVLIEAFADLAGSRSDVGLVLCGVSGYQEQGLWQRVSDRITMHQLEQYILVVEDLDHDEFLTAMRRSTIVVRTPRKDGVCSSVLEALSLGTPVVAADNRARPPGVITYPAEDPKALAAALRRVLTSRADIVANLIKPDIRDTVSDEAALLTA
jgi:glycosyltransferase involved in cell wall biosynthesis